MWFFTFSGGQESRECAENVSRPPENLENVVFQILDPRECPENVSRPSENVENQIL